jgi:hypothetical protein
MAEQVTKRHPIRGFFYGIFFGLGLALMAIGQGWAALGTLPPLILVIVGIVIGTLWGFVAPAKKPKGDPPPEPVHVENLEEDRFSDFEHAAPAAGSAVADGVDQITGAGVGITTDAGGAETATDGGEPDEPEASDKA